VVVDSAGRAHIAAECDGLGIDEGEQAASASGLVYIVKTGSAWKRTALSVPADRIDIHPQIAIDGTTLYVAFTRTNLAHRSIGVYYRSRTLPSGAWSAPRLLGKSGDSIHSFRAVNGVLHAIVTSAGGVQVYEMRSAGALSRFVIPGAPGDTFPSLRIGSDGRGRVAYLASNGRLRYARFTGSGFAWSTIPGTGFRDLDPELVLDAQNHAHVVWERPTYPDDPTPGAGTWYATNSSGVWAVRRITTTTGDVSLAVDTVSRRVHVVVGGLGLKYYTKPAAGSWSGLTLVRGEIDAVSIRLRQSTGALIATYSELVPDGPAGVLVFTKP
jgi:hypothetical protein